MAAVTIGMVLAIERGEMLQQGRLRSFYCRLHAEICRHLRKTRRLRKHQQQQRLSFHYDPFSYALNFDDGKSSVLLGSSYYVSSLILSVIGVLSFGRSSYELCRKMRRSSYELRRKMLAHDRSGGYHRFASSGANGYTSSDRELQKAHNSYMAG